MENWDAMKDQDADLLIQNVDTKVKPIFERGAWTDDEKRAIYRYHFAHKPRKLPPSMRHRLINLYDIMADRSKRFEDGLRWCLNVYVGCEHNCGYCYVNGYSQESVGDFVHPKKRFEEDLLKDIQDLRKLGVPAAPLHLSNSTDPLQNTLERHNRHTLYSLKTIERHRERFSWIVILTKNPEILCRDPYLSLITSSRIRPFTVQITCAFWRDEARSFFESCAPNVSSRLEALKFLAGKGVEVELRIDPLFPSSSIEEKVRHHKPLSAYSLPEAQTTEDINHLVTFAKDAGAKAVIAKPLKVPFSKKAQRCKDWFRRLYEDATLREGIESQGKSWRLPRNYQQGLILSVSEICEKQEIEFKHCMKDVLLRS